MGLLMNELYEQTIVINGKTYRYDPDFDCYYRSYPQTPETWHERLISMAGAVILLVILMLIAPPLLEWLK
jgi:hypothetical protein